MDQQAVMEVANVVTKLKMYPYFDICNYILMCLIVREDTLPATTGSTLFSRKHPLACYISSMLLCFSGSFLANFLLGDSLLAPLKNHQDILLASAVWYVLNYTPFDIAFKLVKFLPIKLVIYLLKEVQRVYKVHHAVMFATKLYPGSYLIIVAIGVLKGTGSRYMRVIARLVNGQWDPRSNELKSPSFATKGCVVASIIFICELKGIIDFPHQLLYLGIVMFFVVFRVSSLLLGMGDPFVPFENLFCAVFMGGIWDALKRAMSKESKVEENSNANHLHNDVGGKTKEEKKKD